MAMQKRAKKKVVKKQAKRKVAKKAVLKATKKRRSPPRKRIPDDFKFEIVQESPEVTPPPQSPPAQQLAPDRRPASLRRLRSKSVHTKGPIKNRETAIKSSWTRDRHEHAE